MVQIVLDIDLVRNDPDVVRKDLEKRGDTDGLRLLGELIRRDDQWRKLKQQANEFRRRRNQISREIGRGRDKESTAAREKIDEAERLGGDIERLEQKIGVLASDIRTDLLRIPNLLHESVPIGRDDTENVEISRWGIPKKIDWELKPHGDLIEHLRIGDFKRAAKVSGAGFCYLLDRLVLLDLALVHYTLDFLVRRGYTLVETPMMMRRKPYEGVVDLSDFETMMYKAEGEDLYLIATSEHPIAAMYMNEIIDEGILPLKYAGVSTCFRKEIGAHGVDTKGLFRTHQFNKVEQFVFARPEESWTVHEELIHNAEDIFRELEIPYRVVNVCTGDIGTVAAKKYDLEAWSPRGGIYREVVSCSNCTDYQARRLNIRCGKVGGKKRMVHTLNSTAMATSRGLVAILENYQRKDGSVEIPAVLRPYTGFDVIERSA